MSAHAPRSAWFVAGSADVLYQVAINACLNHGDPVAPRGQPTHELLGPTFVLKDARANIITIPQRRLNYAFSVAEWLWMLLGRRDVATIGYFNKNIAQFSDDGETFAGAYGPKFVAQVDYVVDVLRRDPDTRQALVTFWKPAPGPSKDVPCTVSIQFFIRDGRLHAHGYMRSNDVWLGFPYDLFNFTQLQAYVAALVGVDVGAYRHTVGSFHLYDRNRADAIRTADSNLIQEGLRSPTLSPLPTGFESVFEQLAADTVLSRHLNPDALPDPWGTYASVLAYRTHRDPTRVRPPYAQLILDQQETPRV